MAPHEPKRQRHLRPECRHLGSERTYGRRRGRRRGWRRGQRRTGQKKEDQVAKGYCAQCICRFLPGKYRRPRRRGVVLLAARQGCFNGFHAHAGHARLEFGNWLVEKDNLRRATGVALAVGRKRLPSKVRCFPRMSGQVLRDTVFHSMSLCQAIWPYEMAQDPHLTGIGICFDGTNMRHKHIQACSLFFSPEKNQTRRVWQHSV